MSLTLVHLQSIFKSQIPVALKYIYLLGKGCFLGRASHVRGWICGPRPWALTKNLLDRCKVRLCAGPKEGKMPPTLR